MKCIDFDKEFKRVIAAWVKEHGKDYPDPDRMEDAAMDVYMQFLDTPAAFLGGAKPGEYFNSFTDAGKLVNWMEDYFKQRVPVPDMLLNRIAELGLKAESPLMRLLEKELTPRDARMCAMTLLREIGSLAPMQMYIDLQKNRSGDDEIADMALEGLASMGPLATAKAMREALDQCGPDGQEALLTLLCGGECDDELFRIAASLFETRPDRMGVLADVLGKLGDERALPLLIAAAQDADTSYLDYIELRNAIERLGGEVPDRSFDENDPAYEALRGMQ